MNDYAALERRHARLAILRLLKESTGYSANEAIIHTALPALSFKWPRDRVRGELAWLAEQGLVTLSDYGGLLVAELTQRGLDLADGSAVHPDVERPSPRAQ